jgi:lactoylglutathione lyase
MILGLADRVVDRRNAKIRQIALAKQAQSVYASKEQNRNLEMKLGYVIHYVPDVVAASAFYKAAFGLETRFVAEGQFAELVTGETALGFADEKFIEDMVGVFQPNRPDSPPAGTEVAFVVDDVELAYKKALFNGAVAVMAPKQKPWGQIVAYVRDCNGALVELCTKVG